MPEANGPLLIKNTGSPDELVALLEWFRREDALRGRVRVLPEQIGDGRTEDLSGALLVAVGAGDAAAAGSIATAIIGLFVARRSEKTHDESSSLRTEL
ncbi:effector-associated constant component EACC1 [Nocardia arizonensis]|uniref:effector-associated constant component EACC1 n=1 Tax=Nocardia arizonensis TaxID=1141647 RepID=UPI0006D03FA6|nr:hypothetical protein [Nocardia arizonensis]